TFLERDLPLIPTKGPTEVELHLIIFFDDRRLTVLASPGSGAVLLDANLKAFSLLAPVAVANPDEPIALGRNLQRLGHHRSVIIGRRRDRQKSALAPLVPFGGPAWSRKPPIAVGLLHGRFAQRPAVAFDAVEMFSFEPDAFSSQQRASEKQYAEGDEREQRAMHVRDPCCESRCGTCVRAGRIAVVGDTYYVRKRGGTLQLKPW